MSIEEKLNKHINQLKQNKIVNSNSENKKLLKNINTLQKQENRLNRKNIHINKKDLFKKVGVLDVEGFSLNPLTGKKYENVWANSNNRPATRNEYAKIWSSLPMYERKEGALETFFENQVVLVIAGTGAGKTVLAPLFLLHTLNYKGRVAVTVPKQIMAQGSGTFAAKILDVKIGHEVGYQYMGTKKVSKNTNLIFTTDGTITAKLASDPLLSEFDALIVDEAHERNVRIDKILLLMKHVLKERPDFKLIIMSATVNQEIFENYYKNDGFKFSTFDAGGKPNFPIKEIYLDKPISKYDKEGVLLDRPDAIVKKCIEIMADIIVSSEKGDILAFFPGDAELKLGCQLLDKKIKNMNKNRKNKIVCKQLQSKTSNSNKKYITNANAYKKNGFNRKIVFSTEVAESGVTIDGIDYVIDSGLSQQSWYIPESNVSTLQRKRISQASHLQRRGRTGRTKPGTCYNLFTENEFKKFPKYSDPQILTEDFKENILNFMINDVVSYSPFPFSYKTNSKKDSKSLDGYLSQMITPPDEKFINIALIILFSLGAIEVKNKKATVTDLGRAMRKFQGISPELARTIIASHNYRCRNIICDVVALISVSGGKTKNYMPSDSFIDAKPNSNKFKKGKEQIDKIMKKYSNSYGDVITLLTIYEGYRLKKYTNETKTPNERELSALEWCFENYMTRKKDDPKSCNNFKKVHDKAGNLRRTIQEIVNEQKNILSNQLAHTTSSIGNDNEVILFENSDDIIISENKIHNIIKSILRGNFINMAGSVKKGGNKYMQCFPPTQNNKIEIDMDSVYSKYKSKPNICVYLNLFKRGSSPPKMGVITMIPKEIFDEFKQTLKKEKKYKLIEKCFA